MLKCNRENERTMMMNTVKHRALNGLQLCAEMGFSRWTLHRCIKDRAYRMKYGNRTTLEHFEQWLEANPFTDGRKDNRVENPRVQAAMLKMGLVA
jgi:hypothetical protein